MHTNTNDARNLGESKSLPMCMHLKHIICSWNWMNSCLFSDENTTDYAHKVLVAVFGLVFGEKAILWYFKVQAISNIPILCGHMTKFWNLLVLGLGKSFAYLKNEILFSQHDTC